MPCTSQVDLAFFFFDAVGFFVEDRDEFVADDFALLFGIGDSGKLCQKALGGVDGDHVQSELVAQVLLNFFKFVFAQHAVVHKDASQSRFAAPSRMARSTSTAATEESTPPERAQIARPLPTCLAHLRDGGIDEVLRGPGGFGSANIQSEVAQNVCATRRVVNFGMKLHGPHLRVGDSRWRQPRSEILRSSESLRAVLRFVAVRHPDCKILGQSLKQPRSQSSIVNFGVTVFALVGRAHFSAERVHHELQPVADAEHGQRRGRRRAGSATRSVFVIDRRRAAGENDSNRRVASNFFERGVAGKDDGEDVLFADAARDQLRILRPEVEDNDRLGFHG